MHRSRRTPTDTIFDALDQVRRRPLHAVAVAKRIGFHDSHSNRITRVLQRAHSLGIVHIGGWRRSNAPIYKWGPGKDAPRPPKLPPAKRPAPPLRDWIDALFVNGFQATADDVLGLLREAHPDTPFTLQTVASQMGRCEAAGLLRRTGRRVPSRRPCGRPCEREVYTRGHRAARSVFELGGPAC